jgi:hypothetical protein
MSDDQSVSATVPGDDAFDTGFAPYITAVGEVVNAWNKMQEQLNKLFVAVTGMSSGMASSIWHSVRSDSLQRDLLAAAVRATPNEKWASRHPEAKADLLALLACAERLSQQRNDAIHAPVSLAIDKDKLVPIPVYFFGNPRAKRLKGKDVINEFRQCRDDAFTLKEFAEKAETALSFASYAWPDKPALLEPPPKKTQANNPDRQARKGRR